MRGDGQGRVPRGGRFDLVPPSRGPLEGEIDEIGVVALAPPTPDDLPGFVEPFDAGEDLELLAELGDPHGPWDRSALGPGGQPASVPTLERGRQRGAYRLAEAEADRERIGDLARGAEVELGPLAPAGEDREHRRQSRHPGSPGARPADHQADDLGGVGVVRLQGGGPYFDLVAEHHRRLEGVAGAAEEAQRRGPPGGPLLGRIGADRDGEVLAEHGGAQLRPGRLAERVVLRHREQRRDLRLGDVNAHAATV